MTKFSKAASILFALASSTGSLAFTSSASSRPTAAVAFIHSSSKLYAENGKLPIVGEETIMKPKEHGTSSKPVMKDLKWECDFDVADRICNFNR
jgi:hypothetical protein